MEGGSRCADHREVLPPLSAGVSLNGSFACTVSSTLNLLRAKEVVVVRVDPCVA